MSDTQQSGTASFIRENLEAFAVAVAMALVIRHFCVEAFRIPTASMEPTLYGDHTIDGERRHGDRILVDKFVKIVRDPRRFEVWVFRYPLNYSKNYIKRVTGLPGEWLQTVDGDLWISSDQGKTWRIPYKPADVRERHLAEYWPHPVSNPDAFTNVRCWILGKEWTLDETAIDSFEVDAGDEPIELEFARRIVPYHEVDNSGRSREKPVGDVRLGFDVEIQRRGTLKVRIRDHRRDHVLTLGPEGSFMQAAGDHPELDLDWRLTPGTHSISFANVDDVLYAVLDGREFELSFAKTRDAPPAAAPRPASVTFPDQVSDNGVMVIARDLKARLSEMRLERDIYYNHEDKTPRSTGEEYWEIPEGHFFMMGDNTGHSKDSRSWEVLQVELKSGEIVRWEGGEEGNPFGAERPTNERAMVIHADVDGLVRQIYKDDVEKGGWSDARTEQPFVPRSHLVGRAFVIFWPIFTPPVYKGPSRVKWIR